jgi:hypothetical protein
LTTKNRCDIVNIIIPTKKVGIKGGVWFDTVYKG